MGKRAAIAVALTLALAAAAGAATVSVVPSTTDVKQGDTFTLDVIIEGAVAPGVEVLNVEIEILTLNLVSCLAVVEGEFFQQQAPEPLQVWGLEIDNVAGTVSYTISRLGPNTSTGSGTAATLTYVCDTAALTFFDVFVELDVTDTGGTIVGRTSTSVSMQANVPEPVSLALLGVALAGLAAVRLRRR